MVYVILFIFGIAIGSFMNVLALRYDGDHFLFDTSVIGGRSHCPHCKRTLRWFELIPLFSYLAQGGKCRTCKTHIGMQYPIVEFLSGAIFAFVPLRLVGSPWLFSAFWIAAFELLLLVAYIDIRLEIVPDELTVILAVLALFETIFAGNVWTPHLIGALFGGGFFGLLVLVTRGKGMGMGDVKLGIPLGLLFGWPEILLLYAAAFVIGAVAGIGYLMWGKRSQKSPIPFVPFLTTGALFVFFFGAMFLNWYFHLIGLG